VLFWADNLQHKRKLLDHWLRDTGMAQAIVFASTQIECDGLANDLQQDGFSAVALHGALSQGLRNRRLMALRQGQVQILVATDVAARGLDVPNISHVFNFGLPMKAEDYTHRIGRTGRAGRDGIAVTFAELRDRRRIQDIESYTRQPFKAEVLPGLEPRVRVPESRPFGRGSEDRGGFGGGFNRDRRPAGGDRGFGPARGGNAGGFAGDRNARGPIPTGPRHFAPHHSPARGEPHFAARDAGHGQHNGFERNTGAGFGAPRRDAYVPRRAEGFAPRSAEGFAPRSTEGFAPRKPAFAKPGNGGKVFVPRDGKKSFR
jgi:hypothetical protein